LPDTNVLLSDIARFVRQHPKPTALQEMSRTDLVRVFLSETVVAEVDEHIESWMYDRGIDAVAANECWRLLKRHVWVVDATGLALNDERVLAVYEADADDGGTAALAVALRIKALSRDRHLLDVGLALGEDWLQIVFASGAALLGEAADAGVMVGVGVPTIAGVEGVRAMRTAWNSPNGRRVITGIGLAIGGVAIAFLLVALLSRDFRAKVRCIAADAKKSITEGGGVVVRGYAEVTVKKVEAYKMLRTVELDAPAEPHLIDVLIRLLARSLTPLSTHDLACRIWNYERPTASALAYLRAELSKYPAFVNVGDDRWSFGGRLGTSMERFSS
jgi:PIN domain